jgi:hypothetical protein
VLKHTLQDGFTFDAWMALPPWRIGRPDITGEHVNEFVRSRSRVRLAALLSSFVQRGEHGDFVMFPTLAGLREDPVWIERIESAFPQGYDRFWAGNRP